MHKELEGDDRVLSKLDGLTLCLFEFSSEGFAKELRIVVEDSLVYDEAPFLRANDDGSED